MQKRTTKHIQSIKFNNNWREREINKNKANVSIKNYIDTYTNNCAHYKRREMHCNTFILTYPIPLLGIRNQLDQSIWLMQQTKNHYYHSKSKTRKYCINMNVGEHEFEGIVTMSWYVNVFPNSLTGLIVCAFLVVVLMSCPWIHFYDGFNIHERARILFYNRYNLLI